MFKGTNGLKMEAYSDADWGASKDRKSISGSLFTLAGGAVSWQSKKQPTVALSSTEAETMALLQAVKESLWIQRLLSELGRKAEDQDLIKEDNQSAIALAHNPEHHARTKHIDIQYHFMRECVEDGKVRLEYCSTSDMVADGLTKALARDRHQDLTRRMGLERVGASVDDEPLHYHQPETDNREILESGSIGNSESFPTDVTMPSVRIKHNVIADSVSHMTHHK